MSGKNQHETNPQQSLVTKTQKWRNTFIYIVKIWIFGPSLKIHTSEDRTTEIGRSQGSGVNSVLTEAKPLLIAKRPNSFNKAYPVYPSPWVNIRSGASQWRALGRSRIESILVLPIYVTLRLLLCCVRFTDFPFIVEWLGQTVLYSHFSPWIEEVVWDAIQGDSVFRLWCFQIVSDFYTSVVSRVKVHILWEGYKIWKNLPSGLTKQLFLLSCFKTTGIFLQMYLWPFQESRT